MFTYLLNKWTISQKFEESDSGWVYKHWTLSDPIPVSEEERSHLIAKFAHHGWWNFPILIGGLFALTLVVVIIAYVFPDFRDQGFVEVSAYVGVSGLMSVIFWRWYRAYTYPKRYLAGREPVGEHKSWFESWRELQVQAGWPRLIFAVILLASLIWISIPNGWPITWWHGLWLAYLVALLLLSSVSICLKIKSNS